MTGQVIISGDGWVLDKHGELLAEAFGFELLTEPKPMPADGVTYLMNYMQCRKLTYFEGYGSVVSMLTHKEPRLAVVWDIACEQSTTLVPMSATTSQDIPAAHRAKATTIPLPAPDYITQRRPRIGIAGIRNQANEHRKGWDLVDRLRADHPEWDITTTGGSLTEPEMLAWYRSLDVYLCPSRYEGGPMGVAEAAALCIRTVAPQGVGWCDDYLLRRYTAGDYEHMRLAVTDSVDECMQYANMRSPYISTEQYIEAHRRLFASLT